jgi:hypothetical protein
MRSHPCERSGVSAGPRGTHASAQTY